MSNTPTNLSTSSDWIKQLPSAILLVDTQFNFVNASPNWLLLFGQTQTGLKNKNIEDLIPALNKEWETRLKYCIKGSKNVKIVEDSLTSHTDNSNLIWDLNPWKDGYGTIIGVILKVETVSKTSELERELRKNKILLSQDSNLPMIGSWEYKVATKQLTWSKAVKNIYGVQKDFEPTLEKALNFYASGEANKTMYEAITNAVTTGKPWNEKLQLTQVNGNKIYVNTIGRPKFKDGVCHRIIGTVQNINDTYHLTSEKEKLDNFSIYNNVACGVLITDFESGIITNVNHGICTLTGYDKDYFIGSKALAFLRNKELLRKDLLKHTINKIEGFQTFTATFSSKEGTKLTLKFSNSYVTNTLGKKNILTSVENVSENIELRRKYKKVTESFKQQNLLLVDFTHKVSHNLKAHATNFSLLLNFLEKEEGESERNQLMKMLFTSKDKLANTIKSLREFVSIKEKKDTPNKLISLNESVFNVEQNLTDQLRENRVKIINEIPDNVRIKALPTFVESVLTNCLNNAISFRNQDKNPLIILSVQDTYKHTILSIEDNGSGIDMNKFGSKLFEPYTTCHKNNKSQGVGLFLSKNKMEAMDGKLTATSVPNQGSIFKLHFIKA